MKQTLEFKLGQHLAITPQLQQAIRLLQLSSIELQQEIQEALESNPMLEEGEEESAEDRDTENTESSDKNGQESGSLEPTDIRMESSDTQDDGMGADNYSAEDGEVGDWGSASDTSNSSTSSNNSSDDFPDIESRNALPQSLTDHLEWQLQMSTFSDRDLKIAYAIIDSISEDGYLCTALEDIQNTLNKDEEDSIEIDEIEAVLHRIQNFDPVGVGARDLSECIQLQLRILDDDTPFLEQARLLATKEHLATLANRDTASLKRKLRLRQEELQQAILLIQHQNPRPGGAISTSHAAYIVPDIIVKKVKSVWRADLNSDVSPRLRINKIYEKLIQRGKASNDKKYLQEQLQQARWLIKSLNSRNETLLKVSRMIVDRQRAFFNHGAEAMKPLVLHDIAEAVEMHESTISRITTNKYMLTPRGIFELKYFFSSHVGTADGGTCSATAIRSLIKKLVAGEPSHKPISDSAIAQLLEDQGINVARRTIAKYRESMNIPPSNQRKSLI
ncbi:MAG: RNA polymerase factor sigma-54 [Gammaproteobacteria bacterium]|nr:MAG: RNA polymerase factor sigma-54 [Gammaproteobacteria bacterium]